MALTLHRLLRVRVSVVSLLRRHRRPISRDAHDAAAGNIAGMAFPLFTQQMYARLTYKWANTLFGLIAALMIPIPFVSLPFSPFNRGRSNEYIFLSVFLF